MQRRTYKAKWHQTKLTVHKEMYTEQKKTVVTDLIKSAKTNNYTQKVMECVKNQKALFKVIDILQGEIKVPLEDREPHGTLQSFRILTNGRHKQNHIRLSSKITLI